MYDRNGVRLSLIHALPSAAEASGVSLPEVLSLGGLEGNAFGDPDKVVRRSQIHAMMQGLARKSGDATIGFRMADASTPDMLGLFGRSLFVGRTLREALLLQRLHMPSLQRGATIAMATSGARFVWTHRMHGSDPGDARFLNEGIAAFFVRTVRAICGDDDARLHVVLPHRPIVPLSRYEEALRCGVSFRPGHDLVITFEASLLDRRNVLSRDVGPDLEPASAAAVPLACDLSDDQLLQSLLRIFEVAALMGKLTLPDASQTLGLSARSLQRRLAAIDTSFEEVLDQWRHSVALDLLCAPDGGTGKVAARLGYTDASHFIRAFRRWQGVSPTDFRRERAMSEAGASA